MKNNKTSEQRGTDLVSLQPFPPSHWRCLQLISLFLVIAFLSMGSLFQGKTTNCALHNGLNSLVKLKKLVRYNCFLLLSLAHIISTALGQLLVKLRRSISATGHCWNHSPASGALCRAGRLLAWTLATSWLAASYLPHPHPILQGSR